ncbi:MAG: PilW family protein [Acidobacteriota bacterium]
MRPTVPARRRSRAQRGFTLIELLASLIIMTEIIVAVLVLFDFNNKLTHVQTQVADMQQSLRVAQFDMVRLLRMAGRGGLPATPLPQSVAVAVRKTTNSTTNIALGGSSTTSRVLKDTDVLTLRGVFSTPIYQVNYTSIWSLALYDAANNVTTDPTQAAAGMIEICNVASSGVPQDGTYDSSGNPTGYLKGLRDLITAARPEALVLTSPLDDSIYAVVEFDPTPSAPLTTSATSTNCPPADPSDATHGVRLAFKVGNTAGTLRRDKYRGLYPGASGLPSGLSRAAYLGIVEEYRYYVRQEFEVAGDSSSESAPRLARARFYPNTEEAYADDDQNLRLDLADDITDLQVALGIDTLKAGVFDGIIDDSNDANDEWLYNAAADDDTNAKWASGRLLYVRISTVARTDRRDTTYQAPVIARIEDHTYASTDYDNQDKQRMFRRRMLETVVKMRNLG